MSRASEHPARREKTEQQFMAAGSVVRGFGVSRSLVVIRRAHHEPAALEGATATRRLASAAFVLADTESWVRC